MMRSSWKFLALVVLAVTGCEPSEPATPSAPFTSHATLASLGLNLCATRRWSDYSSATPMTLTERAIDTASGGWSVTLLSLNGEAVDAITDPDARTKAKKLEKQLAEGPGRYVIRGRDFRIRNWDLFLANYGWSLISSDTTVAGRPVHVADVWPLNPGRPHYTVWVDQETQLTLKYLEFMPTGELASEMEVLELEWNPDLSGVALRPEVQKATADSQFWSSVSFQTFHLAYVPAGFALLASESSTLNGSIVLTQTFSDGVQEITFGQYDPYPLNPPDMISDTDEPISVRTTTSGARIQASFDLLGTALHVHSKLTTDEVMNVLESITPNP